MEGRNGEETEKQSFCATLSVFKELEAAAEVRKVLGFVLMTLAFFFFNFILLYNTVLVLPYINMNPPQVYMSSQS